MINIDSTIKQLAASRPIFHSEADFQHTLAWEIHKVTDKYSIRLEYPSIHDSDTYYVDIVLFCASEKIGIELKYKTRILTKNIDGEVFSLQNQSAQDLGRYDFIKDIHRMEELISKKKLTAGLCVFLTNDSAYWKIPDNRNTIDREFRIHEGKIITGLCSWNGNPAKGTVKNRETPLDIQGKYQCNWQKYSVINAGTWGELKYICFPINGII